MSIESGATTGEALKPVSNYVGTCLDFAEAAAEFGVPIQFVGGISAAILGDPAIQIDYNNKIIYCSDGFEMSQLRANGTLRDVDMLALTTDPAKIKMLKTILECVNSGRQEISLFGLSPRNNLGKFSSRILSDRFASPALDVNNPDLRYIRGFRDLYTFAPAPTMEAWKVEFPDGRILSVPSPADTLLRYTFRSIGGLRKKDEAKTWRAIKNIESKAPELIEEIRSGQFQALGQLALRVAALRPRHDHTLVEHLTGEKVRASSLHGIGLGALLFSKTAAHLIGGVESSEKLTSLWQLVAENLKLIRKITGVK
ncbi:MAG: hypothetical protein LBM73_00235 [Candidatus Nomurabacteria bacterium]|jgi:hypothetical protein|nr:hypothetical protein [Candidatus Nomurabacteria bacterium]